MALTLTADERTELERRLRSLKIRAEDARRARVILLLADGASYSEHPQARSAAEDSSQPRRQNVAARRAATASLADRPSARTDQIRVLTGRELPR